MALLKFFQYAARFPLSMQEEVPATAVAQKKGCHSRRCPLNLVFIDANVPQMFLVSARKLLTLQALFVK